MKTKVITRVVFLLTAVTIGFVKTSNAQIAKDVKIGAYYFDGWTGNSPVHLNKGLTDNFPERKPIWGWVTSTPDIIQKQIEVASNSGVDFFNFCWYYTRNNDGINLTNDPKNNALNLYLKAPNKNKLGFSLLVANAQIYIIKPTDWNKLTEYWCKLFQDPMYVKANGKPLITILGIEDLVKSFGSTDAVKNAFERLRNYAKSKNLGGVTIAACVSPVPKRLELVSQCGYDLVTSYNNHDGAFTYSKNQMYSVSKMQGAEMNIWNALRDGINIPQMPTVTLNWDPRPLDIGKKITSSRLQGFSENSVKKSIANVRSWTDSNISRVTPERIVNVYAWNEYGEGSYLTPTGDTKNNLLRGFKAGVTPNKKR